MRGTAGRFVDPQSSPSTIGRAAVGTIAFRQPADLRWNHFADFLITPLRSAIYNR